jgi:hypothetical protein
MTEQERLAELETWQTEMVAWLKKVPIASTREDMDVLDDLLRRAGVELER